MSHNVSGPQTRSKCQFRHVDRQVLSRTLATVGAGILLLLGLARPAAGQSLSRDERNNLERQAYDLAVRGFKLDQEGKSAAGAKLMEEAVQIHRRLYREEKQPGDTFNFAVLLYNLAVLRARHGEEEKAECIYAESLALCRHQATKTTLPRWGNFTLNVLLNYGSLLQDHGEHARAEELYREALKISQGLTPKEASPKRNNGLATCYANLGSVLAAQGEIASAEAFGREALDMDRAALSQRQIPGRPCPPGHQPQQPSHASSRPGRI